MSEARAPILLYHAVGHHGMAEDRLDTVSAETLRRQLAALRRRYTLVCVDELAAALAGGERSDLAAITFDDAHTSVLAAALPVLEALEVPATVFVNGALAEGGTFWRDKVRHLVRRGLEADFHRFTSGRFHQPGRSLYFATKDPRHDSREVDLALDAFLGPSSEVPREVLALGALRPHRLLTWGNHGHHHYVLSSLSLERQIAEVVATEATLDRRPDLARSRVFAVPFGCGRHFDHHLLGPLRELGFEAVLMARNRWSLASGSPPPGKPVTLDRFHAGRLPRRPALAELLAE